MATVTYDPTIAFEGRSYRVPKAFMKTIDSGELCVTIAPWDKALMALLLGGKKKDVRGTLGVSLATKHGCSVVPLAGLVRQTSHRPKSHAVSGSETGRSQNH